MDVDVGLPGLQRFLEHIALVTSQDTVGGLGGGWGSLAFSRGRGVKARSSGQTTPLAHTACGNAVTAARTVCTWWWWWWWEGQPLPKHRCAQVIACLAGNGGVHTLHAPRRCPGTSAD